MKTKLSFLFIALALGFFINSCDKQPIEPDTETQTAADDYQAQEAVSQIFSTVNHYGINEEGIKSIKADCPIISVDTTVDFPRTLIIDFGTDGCVGPEGQIRKGKLEVTFSGHWYNPEANTSASVVMTDYYVNGSHIEGNYTITYNGLNSFDGPKFTITAENAKLTNTSGDVISWNSTETIEWIQGFDDLSIDNDIILIGGSSSGVSSEGVSYETKITTPLRKEMSCDYIVSGVYEITPEGKATRVIDFGDGTCDDAATVTIGQLKLNITL